MNISPSYECNYECILHLILSSVCPSITQSPYIKAAKIRDLKFLYLQLNISCHTVNHKNLKKVYYFN